MRSRSVPLVAIALILLLLLGLLSLFSELSDNMHHINRIAGERHGDYVLANGLRQTSDDLTRMVRLYAVTGEARYRDYFNEILAIRNGDAPRPDIYFEVPYWDLVLASGVRPGAASETLSIRWLVQHGSFSEEELALLQEAEDRSNDLVQLEAEVMAVVDAALQSDPGDYRLQGEALEAMLRLHGSEYHLAKEQIMLPLVRLTQDVSQDLVDTRSELYRNIRDYFWYILTVAAFATLCGVLLLRVTGRRGYPLTETPGILSVLVVFSLLCSIFWILQLHSEQDYIHAHLNRRFDAWRLSDGLRQSSDDLTRMVRLHAVTGEARYREYFEGILDIRNGLAPRPVHYYEIPYWDVMLASGEFDGQYSGPAPISHLARDVGFTGVELALLRQSEVMSNDLVELENEAMAAVAHQKETGDGAFSLEGEVGDAVLRLHGPEYHGAKALVMRPLVELSRMVDESFLEENAHSLERVQQFNTALALSIVFSLIFSGAAMATWLRSPR